MTRIKQYKSLTAAQLKVGDSGHATYCDYLMGVAGKPPVVLTVTKIGPKWVTLSNNIRVAADGQGMFGFVKEIK